MIGLPDAAMLGIVEGVTEFLPISSTGHLILAAHWLGLYGEEVKTFEIVIQLGAIMAVLALYRQRVRSMWLGLLGRDHAGRRLLGNLVVSFLPAAVIGVLLHKPIKAALFGIWPVVAALAVGGALMIAADWWLGRHRRLTVKTIELVSTREALLIGLAQTLALWPGTSRSMVTMLAALWLGLPPAAAAEYSFLLALPTLGAAALFDAVRGGEALIGAAGAGSVLIGFVMAGLTAALAIRGFVQYLGRGGLAPFGWYRLALALIVLIAART